VQAVPVRYVPIPFESYTVSQYVCALKSIKIMSYVKHELFVKMQYIIFECYVLGRVNFYFISTVLFCT